MALIKNIDVSGVVKDEIMHFFPCGCTFSTILTIQYYIDMQCFCYSYMDQTDTNSVNKQKKSLGLGILKTVGQVAGNKNILFWHYTNIF